MRRNVLDARRNLNIWRIVRGYGTSLGVAILKLVLNYVLENLTPHRESRLAWRNEKKQLDSVIYTSNLSEDRN